MILVDTSVWIDHLRSGESVLVTALEGGQVLMHPYVLGELTCGNLKNRGEAEKCSGFWATCLRHRPPRIRRFWTLRTPDSYGAGIGYIDVHLLASTVLEGVARLWTHDRRLDEVTAELNPAFEEGR